MQTDEQTEQPGPWWVEMPPAPGEHVPTLSPWASPEDAAAFLRALPYPMYPQ